VIVLPPPPPFEPIDLTGGGTASRRPAGRPAGEQTTASDETTPLRPTGPGLTPPVRLPSRPDRAAPPRPLQIESLYDRVWLSPGAVLRADSAGSAAAVDRAVEMASVPVEARRGDWARVRLRGREGWVDLAAPLPETARPGRGSYLGRHAAEPGGDLLSRVKRRLGLRRPNGRAGAFELYTDVEDQRLLRLLDGAAERLAATPSWPRASATSSPASPTVSGPPPTGCCRGSAATGPRSRLPAGSTAGRCRPSSTG
jgi:hypothetical protein